MLSNTMWATFDLVNTSHMPTPRDETHNKGTVTLDENDSKRHRHANNRSAAQGRP